MFAFGLDNPSGRLDPLVIADLYAHREPIIAAFKDSRLEQDPYLREEPWTAHPVLLAIHAAGLTHHGAAALSAYPAWRSHRAGAVWSSASAEHATAWRQAGAMVDATVHLKRLLDVYEPSKALLHNLYANNVLVGVLGEENVLPARTAMRKHLGKVLGKDFVKPSLYSANRDIADTYIDDLIVIIRLDLVAAHVQGKARSGIAFERHCLQVLERAGFTVRTTAESGDFGADLIAYKDELGYVVQCKDLSKPSGVKAVQEAAAALSHYGVDFAAVCSSGGFTEAAMRLAASNNVVLCGVERLAASLEAARCPMP